jgi:diguanylate cyclase (GGDEF)-like protein/PAS domain S-box-containing protein
MALWNRRREETPDATAVAAVAPARSPRMEKWWASAREGFFECGSDGRLLCANPATARILGYASAEEAERESPSLFAGPFFDDPQRLQGVIAKLRDEGSAEDEELLLRRADSSTLWTRWSFWAAEGGVGGAGLNGPDTAASGGAPGFWGVIADITREKVAEERLLRHAFHDKVTGLPNRNLFMERVATLIRRVAARPAGAPANFALLVVDLDRFKVVNDTLGHGAGDQLLSSTARRLEAVLRPNDLLARLGSDEFGIIFEDVRELQDVLPLIDRIQKRLALPSTIEGQEVFSNASIGIVLGNREDRVETMMRHAEAALYKAKAKGRGRFEVFEGEDVLPRGANAMQLESELRRAVERNEFRAFYQPLVSLASGRIIGFEALVRWAHPRRGMVSPAQFIPIAEDTGLIMPIGAWMLRESCRQLAIWQKRGGRMAGLIMSVNISAKQFGQNDLVRQIDRNLQAAGLDGSSLKLEVTESAIMDNPESAIATLNAFKAYGIKLSLDDFGTGYSSLSYLHRFPFNVLKIDQSFVSQMEASSKNEEIVRTIVALAHTLRMDVIAEGVETASQLDHLRALKCHYGQGYFFAGPLDVDSATEMLLADPEW